MTHADQLAEIYSYKRDNHGFITKFHATYLLLRVHALLEQRDEAEEMITACYGCWEEPSNVYEKNGGYHPLDILKEKIKARKALEGEA